MKPPVVPTVSLIVALLALIYLYFTGDFLLGVLVFGLAAIALRVGLSTHRRRGMLRDIALEKYAQERAASSKEEFIASYIKGQESSETKKTLAALAIAVLVVATWAYLSTH